MELPVIVPLVQHTNGVEKKTIGAGVVSPWGDVTIYNYDFTDYYGVHGNGSSSWY